MPSLGTKSEIALSMESKNEFKLAEYKQEADGIGDRWSEMQDAGEFDARYWFNIGRI